MRKLQNAGRIGVDVGGTFTDIVLEIDGRRHTSKVLTSASRPADACLEGLLNVLAQSGTAPIDIGVIIHGTTLATNAIIERKGAPTSLVTTEGFRDTIEIGTEGRPEQYDINILKPLPLVPRRNRFTVHERLDRNGNVLRVLQEEDLAKLLPALDAAGTESLAIAFINSYVNPAHEIRARTFYARNRPNWTISISSEVSPEFREFERFSTTCANAYLQPLMSRYLAEFDCDLRLRGFKCPVRLMLSSGGLTSMETARKFPVRLVESGPAGGAIFAGGIAQKHGVDRAMSFDMGGTTAKICLLDHGEAQTSRRFEVARVYRFRKDSGLPLRVPVIDMVEIGAGGGSIARVDDLGRLTVGPESAGANPGPACYGLGGSEFTVTDANLLLGRIDPERFAGGDIPLQRNAAVAAAGDAVSRALEVGDKAAAYGVTEMVCENMSSAARIHAIESGKNTGDRTLIAFGGAAPLHACQMADKIGIDRIIVPTDAGVGSAVGFLRAAMSYEVVQTVYEPLDRFDYERTNRICEAMEDEARSHAAFGAEPNEAFTTRRTAYMRYRGQGHEIAVRVPMNALGPDASETLQERFDQAYWNAFGRNVGGISPGEVVTWSVEVTGPPHPDLLPREQTGAARTHATRTAFDSSTESEIPFAVFARSALSTGEVVPGPAIIVEDETSIVVSSHFTARVLVSGDMELTRNTADQEEDSHA